MLALCVACSAEPAGEMREPAPDFEVLRVDGTTLRLQDLRGRTVLLDFWATWCPPCIAEIPELNALNAELAGREVTILALSVDELTLAELRDWVAEQEIDYVVALADTDLALAYGAEQFPLHVIVDAQGRIAERLEPGYHAREELLAALRRNGAL
jgi:peroxiredoxin